MSRTFEDHAVIPLAPPENRSRKVSKDTKKMVHRSKRKSKLGGIHLQRQMEIPTSSPWHLAEHYAGNLRVLERE
jgi:hypothetical protein